jgi:hypothetical protein
MNIVHAYAVCCLLHCCCSLQARQGLVRAIEGAIKLLGVKTPPVVTRQRAELSAEQSAHAASHLPNLLYLPVLKWSSTQGCYKVCCSVFTVHVMYIVLTAAMQ